MQTPIRGLSVCGPVPRAFLPRDRPSKPPPLRPSAPLPLYPSATLPLPSSPPLVLLLWGGAFPGPVFPRFPSAPPPLPVLTLTPLPRGGAARVHSRGSPRSGTPGQPPTTPAHRAAVQVRPRMPNAECRMPNAECRIPNAFPSSGAGPFQAPSSVRADTNARANAALQTHPLPRSQNNFEPRIPAPNTRPPSRADTFARAPVTARRIYGGALAALRGCPIRRRGG
jgi:hypothetical protein